MSEKKEFQSEIEKELYVRYAMDPQVWRNSSRSTFPFNASFDTIVYLPMVAPILFLIINLTVINQDFQYLRTIFQTIAVSVAGYFITDRMIPAFQDSLRDKGLFGRDLNKAGVQQNKEKVPEALGIVSSIVFLVVTI